MPPRKIFFLTAILPTGTLIITDHFSVIGILETLISFVNCAQSFNENLKGPLDNFMTAGCLYNSEHLLPGCRGSLTPVGVASVLVTCQDLSWHLCLMLCHSLFVCVSLDLPSVCLCCYFSEFVVLWLPLCTINKY